MPLPAIHEASPGSKTGTGIEPAISNVLPTAFVAKHCSDKIADTSACTDSSALPTELRGRKNYSATGGLEPPTIGLHVVPTAFAA